MVFDDSCLWRSFSFVPAPSSFQYHPTLEPARPYGNYSISRNWICTHYWVFPYGVRTSQFFTYFEYLVLFSIFLLSLVLPSTFVCTAPPGTMTRLLYYISRRPLVLRSPFFCTTTTMPPCGGDLYCYGTVNLIFTTNCFDHQDKII